MKIKTFFKETFRSIKNLFIYFKIISQTRDWDHFYMYEIIEFKLKQMLKYAEKYTTKRVLNASWQIKYMKLSLKMLKIIKEGNFHDESFWEKITYDFIPCDDRKEYFEMKSISKYSEEEISNQIKKEHEYERKYKKLFWKIVERRIETWWD